MVTHSTPAGLLLIQVDVRPNALDGEITEKVITSQPFSSEPVGEREGERARNFTTASVDCGAARHEESYTRPIIYL